MRFSHSRTKSRLFVIHPFHTCTNILDNFLVFSSHIQTLHHDYAFDGFGGPKTTIMRSQNLFKKRSSTTHHHTLPKSHSHTGINFNNNPLKTKVKRFFLSRQSNRRFALCFCWRKKRSLAHSLTLYWVLHISCFQSILYVCAEENQWKIREICLSPRRDSFFFLLLKLLEFRLQMPVFWLCTTSLSLSLTSSSSFSSQPNKEHWILFG